MKTKISLAIILLLFIKTTNVYSQDGINKKASLVFGLTIDRFTAQLPDIYEYIPEFNWGFVNSAEIHVPTKFSENIKLVFGGQYLYKIIYYESMGADRISLSGGGIFAGINGEKYFTSGDFNFGLYAQADISYRSFVCNITDRVADTFESITYSGAGSQFKIGMIVKYKTLSFRPHVNFNNLFINKVSSLSIKGLGFGADIGFDF